MYANGGRGCMMYANGGRGCSICYAEVYTRDLAGRPGKYHHLCRHCYETQRLLDTQEAQEELTKAQIEAAQSAAQRDQLVSQMLNEVLERMRQGELPPPQLAPFVALLQAIDARTGPR